MKKLLSILLVVVMLLSLFGCAASQDTTAKTEETKSNATSDAADTQTTADSTDGQQEPVTLKFYTSAPEQEDQQAVFDKLNEYFQEKYNTTVEWYFLGGEYKDKINVIISSGEEYDACFTSNWKNDYLTNVAREAFVDITDMLSDYPALYAALPEAFWDATKVGGRIYAVPNQQITARQLGIMASTEYMEATGYDEAYFTSAESILDTVDYLKACKDEFGAMFGGISWENITNYLGYEMLGANDLGLAVKYGDGEAKVVNMYATDEFKQLCLDMVELEEQGLLDGQVMIDGDYQISQMTAQRVSLAYSGTMKPGGDVEQSNRWGYPVMLAGYGTPYLTTGGVLATMWGVSTTSQHPDRVLQILELLETDEYAMNLISYGIEGVHYEYTDEAKTTIRSIDGAGYAPSYSWAFGNVFLTHVYEGQPADVWEQTAELNANAEVSPLMGFSYSISAVEAEVANIINTVQSYNNVVTGTVDVESTISEMVDKMNIAGMDKVLEDAQAQVDAFLGK